MIVFNCIVVSDVLFVQKFMSPTKLELEQRRITAFNNLTRMKRGFVSYWLGIEVNKGFGTLLKIVQSPELNKQVIFNVFFYINAYVSN